MPWLTPTKLCKLATHWQIGRPMARQRADLSIGMPPFKKCPACRLAWEPTIWLVVDAAHRPDLLLKVRDGALHSLQCPACAKSIEMNAPFLVVREQAPRLLFSPSPGTTSFDDHNQLV